MSNSRIDNWTPKDCKQWDGCVNYPSESRNCQSDIWYEIGELARAHRKSRAMPLDKIAGLANLGIRFLSEFERGKETAEIGKVLKALQTLGLEIVIQPRRVHARGNEDRSFAKHRAKES